jgi:hypothetical protein
LIRKLEDRGWKHSTPHPVVVVVVVHVVVGSWRGHTNTRSAHLHTMTS